MAARVVAAAAAAAAASLPPLVFLMAVVHVGPSRAHFEARTRSPVASLRSGFPHRDVCSAPCAVPASALPSRSLDHPGPEQVPWQPVGR